MKWLWLILAGSVCVLWLAINNHGYSCILLKETPIHMARRDTTMLASAMMRYEDAYGPPPYHEFEPGAIYGDQRLITEGTLMEALLGHPVPGIAKPSVILKDLQKAANGRSGLVVGEGPEKPKYVDPWGAPYIIIVDANRDKSVKNPDADNTDEWIRGFAPSSLADSLIVYSKGADGIDKTADDCTSWRSAVLPPSPRMNPFQSAMFMLVGMVLTFIIVSVHGSLKKSDGNRAV